jgi:hypothetical protein
VKHTLFSIHGIYTDGDWQKGAERVVKDLFDHRPIHYPEYRRFAILKLAGDLILLILGTGILLIGSYEHWYRSATHAAVSVALLAVGFIITNVYLQQYMTRLVTRIHLEHFEPIPLGSNPSVVAHSLGSYLICSVFERFEGVRLRRIILDGCVVTRTYPWSKMVQRFERVFNEIGGTDPVPHLAALLGLTRRGMGSAGARGFRGAAVTRGMINPSGSGPVWEGEGRCCPQHAMGFPAATFVHNVRYDRIPHSGYHTGVTHARRFWLPRLLGYDPNLYMSFYESCQKVADSGGRLESEKLRDLDALRKACWGWTNGPMENLVKREVFSIGRGAWTNDEVEALAEFSILNTASLTTEAVSKLNNREPTSPEHSIFLDPRLALHKSIAASIQVARAHGLIH